MRTMLPVTITAPQVSWEKTVGPGFPIASYKVNMAALGGPLYPASLLGRSTAG